jgi:hypothetical protein
MFSRQLTSRFDHDEIRALIDITLDRLHREPTSTTRQLVSLSISELRSTAGRITERSIKHRGELRRVAHHRHAMLQTGLLQAELDRTDATIHHVGGSDDVRTTLGKEDGHLGDALDAGRTKRKEKTSAIRTNDGKCRSIGRSVRVSVMHMVVIHL